MSQMPVILSGARKARLTVLLGLALAQAGCLAVTAFSVRGIFANLHSAGPGQGNTALLVAILLSGAGLAVVRIAERHLAEGIGQDYAAEVRAALFECLSKRPASDISAKRSGSLSLRFVGDLTAIKGWVSQGLTRFISAVLVLTVGSGLIFLMNPELAVAVVVPSGAACLMIAGLGMQLAGPERAVRSQRARLASDMSERAPHAPELRLMGRLKRELALLERRASGLRTAAVRRACMGAAVKSVPDITAAVMTAWILWTALASELAPSDAAGMLAAAGLMSLPLRDLAAVANRRYAWIVARAKCERVLGNGGTAPDRPATAQKPKRGKVAVRGFRTDQICRFSSTIRHGELVTLVGPPGSGKSYLLRCLAGLDRPLGGTVTVGSCLRGTAREDRPRRRLMFVGPETPILSGSLRRALTMGLSKLPTDREILKVARHYGLGSLLDRIDSLDDRVSENGRNLSTGERGALLLVRAVLNRPALLILDEADSRLGPEWRQLIRQLQAETGATVIAGMRVRHGAGNGDRAWTLKAGRLSEKRPDSSEDAAALTLPSVAIPC